MSLKSYTRAGFTLIEIMVVITIIALLSAALFVNFNDARMLSRDKARMTSLKELQLSLEFYKAQYGSYPVAGCGVSSGNFAGPGPASAAGFSGNCDLYIAGLVPDFISVLPTDPRSENTANMGYYYRSNGNSFKLMIYDSVETTFVTSYGDEFARCPGVGGSCGGAVPGTTYAVYSAGAENW